MIEDDGHEEQFMTIMKDGRIESDEYFPKRGRGRPRGIKNIKQTIQNLNALAAVKKELSDDYINVSFCLSRVMLKRLLNSLSFKNFVLLKGYFFERILIRR